MAKRRIVAAAAVVTAAALALSGCSGGAAGTDDGGKITLTQWAVTGNPESRALQKELLADFQKTHPNITVQVVEKGVDQLKSSLRQTIGTPAAPDMYGYWSGLGLGGELVKLGASLDLTKYYKQYGWDDRFTPTALASVKQYGGYNGVPGGADVEAIVYNKDLFEKAGITDVPTTYEELVEDAKTLKAAGITPIEFGGTVNWYVMRLLDNLLETKCGAETNDQLLALKADWSKEPCVTEAFTDLKTWADDYFNPGWVSMTDQQGQAVFQQNKAAMMLEGDWIGGTLAAAKYKGNLGVFAFPTGTGRVYGLQTGTYISKTSKHPDAAAEWLNYTTSPEVQNKFAKLLVSGLPTVQGVTAVDNGSGITQSFLDIANQATGQFQNNDQSFPADVVTEYWRIQNGVATGEIPPAQAGAQMQKFIDAR